MKIFTFMCDLDNVYPIDSDDEYSDIYAKADDQVMSEEETIRNWIKPKLVYTEKKVYDCDFFGQGTWRLATWQASQLLGSTNAQWLPVELRNCPSAMETVDKDPLYIIRFGNYVEPHKKSKIHYFDKSMKEISTIEKLVLTEPQVSSLYGFRVIGDSVENYVTDNFVKLYNQLGLKGLIFDELPSVII